MGGDSTSCWRGRKVWERTGILGWPQIVFWKILSVRIVLITAKAAVVFQNDQKYQERLNYILYVCGEEMFYSYWNILFEFICTIEIPNCTHNYIIVNHKNVKFGKYK